MKKFFFLVFTSSFTFATPAFAAVPQKALDYKVSNSKVPKYKVAMRLGLKGGAPMSINTIARSGKKSYRKTSLSIDMGLSDNSTCPRWRCIS